MDYSFGITLKKGFKYFVLFGLPFIADQFIINYPQWAQLTLGGLLVMLVNVAKARFGVRLGGLI